MNVYLLYPQKEWANTGRYYDEKAIIQDLGLKTLFQAAAKKIERKDGQIKHIKETDTFLEDTMKKVVMVPLETEEEILYRQEILRDCLAQEKFILRLYDLSTQILSDWDKLGRRAGQKAGARSPRTLVTEIHVLRLFVESLSELRKLFGQYEGKLHSRGFCALLERLRSEFSEETESDLRRILKDVSFYANEKEHEESAVGRMENKPRIVVGCSVQDGLKLGGFKLEEVATDVKKYRSPNGTLIGRAQEYLNKRTKNSVYVQNETALLTQAGQLEYSIVHYIISSCEPFFNAYSHFFDQLHFQTAFYRGALNLRDHMERFYIKRCYPKVGAREHLRFRELKEFVMSMEQLRNPVGNSCDIDNKRLLIVTGANQGGKSTFLRSIGIAQIMMQCGLMVAAEEYESGIFPSLFTHFTRREDSAMNSGRLDEELGRMSQIIDNLGASSLVLLNESFATTTEKEGSVIAYDIIKALTEAGVKVLAVTHLLSFAQRMYGESSDNPNSGIEFLSAQRMENGRRTFKMVQHAPELTSFGLDLYDEIIVKNVGLSSPIK